MEASAKQETTPLTALALELNKAAALMFNQLETLSLCDNPGLDEVLIEQSLQDLSKLKNNLSYVLRNCIAVETPMPEID